MDPRPFIYKFDVRQMVSDVREPAGVHRYVNSSTFRVIGVSRATYGLVEVLAAEAGVDVYRLVEVLPERLQHFLAEPD